jgi:hypothetical protein
MASNENWSELLDRALFEPGRVNLRQRIADAKDAIRKRMKQMLKENESVGSSISERVALRNALTTLADLHNIAYARKPSGNSRDSRQALTG